MYFVIWPEWNSFTVLAYSLLVVIAVSFGFLERYGRLKMNYSKFRKSNGMSSRTGMFLIYSIPILAHLLAARPYLTNPNLIQVILILVICFHFLKRCLEVLFLHKYSGPIDSATVLQIAASYSFAAYFFGHLHNVVIPNMDFLFVAGFVLFAVGQFFNFHHHKILADLRRDSKDYFIPQQGLFRYVSAPHYLMELCAWLGIALMSRHLASYLIFFWTFGYLLARALKTHDWYHKKFAAYPQERKALLPFLI